MTYPRPVVVVASIAAGIKLLLATAAISDLIGVQIAGIVLAVISAVELVVAKLYVQPQIVPLSNTIAYQDSQAMARAGGAATATTGQLVNTEATVTELLDEDNPRGTPGG